LHFGSSWVLLLQFGKQRVKIDWVEPIESTIVHDLEVDEGRQCLIFG
jgi:hypothetical protein